MAYSIEERGAPYSLDYRVFFKKDDQYISPFHDVHLYANSEKTLYNMVVEVPRWTNAKMEISVSEPLNPIKQDIKKGKLRFVCNCFPHHGYIWNYGTLPQTWEDPEHIDTHTGFKGDNDPIDVCEIGYRVAKRGDIIQVKVLGTLALIDEGETDWKILAIDVNDPLASKLNDIDDVETHMPGFIDATRNWFKIYKIPTGKPPNTFAFNGETRNKVFATDVITSCHDQWKAMFDGSSPAGSIALTNTTLAGSSNITPTEAQVIIGQTPPLAPPKPIDTEVDKWHYVDGN